LAVEQRKKTTFHIADFPLIVVLSDSASPRFRNSSSRNSFHPFKAWISSRNYLTPLLAALHSVLICLGMLTATLPGDAYAESAIAAVNTKQTFNILPSRLEDALNHFAQQTGIKLSFHVAETKGLMTQGLQGDFTVQAGLDRLLTGSGFQAMPQADGYAIKKMQESTANAAPGAASSSGVIVLPSLTVS
jgi:catecholate siderophore receptor